jgi:hypothetical protein
MQQPATDRGPLPDEDQPGSSSSGTRRPQLQAHATSLAPLTLQDIFRARCEALALLVRCCVPELQEAIDVLQLTAVRSGLVTEIGIDGMQRRGGSSSAPRRRMGATNE